MDSMIICPVHHSANHRLCPVPHSCAFFAHEWASTEAGAVASLLRRHPTHDDEALIDRYPDCSGYEKVTRFGSYIRSIKRRERRTGGSRFARLRLGMTNQKNKGNDNKSRFPPGMTTRKARARTTAGCPIHDCLFVMGGMAMMFGLGWNGTSGCHNSRVRTIYIAPSALGVLLGGLTWGLDMSPLWGWGRGGLGIL